MTTSSTSTFWDLVSTYAASHGLHLVFNLYEIDDEDEESTPFTERASYFIDRFGHVQISGVSIRGDYFHLVFKTFSKISEPLERYADSLFYVEVVQDDCLETYDDLLKDLDVEKATKVSRELVAVAQVKRELGYLFSATKIADVDYFRLSDEDEVEYFKGDLTKITYSEHSFTSEPAI